MSRSEWLRTFVAVYRTGSVTAAARSRGVSQPAASQHLAALSRAAGGPVITRSADGVVPTRRGQELYARVAEPLDKLERVLAGLDGGRITHDAAPVRVGASAAMFEAYLLPRLSGLTAPLAASLGDDATLIRLLLTGEVDLAVTASTPGHRPALESHPIGERSFALVAAPTVAPDHLPATLSDLGDWLVRHPWVSYSHEVPATRRFWSTALDRPFQAEVKLVARDLRAVAAAVELGIGVSLLPTYVCDRAIAEGRMVTLFDVTSLVPAEPFFAVLRRSDAAHNELATIVELLRQ